MRRIAPIVLLILALVLQGKLIFSDLSASNILFTDDAALSFAVARTMHEGGPVALIGQPSHLGGRHIGPTYYWFLASAFDLAKGNPETVASICSLGGFFAVLLIIALAAEISPVGARLWGAAGAALVLSASGYQWIIKVPWVNNFLLLPAALACAALWLVLKQGPKLIPTLLLWLSICAQTFLGSAPLVIAFAIISITQIFSKHRITQHEAARVLGSKLIIFLTVLATLGIWAAPIWFELQYPSNLLKIFSLHLSGTETGTVSAGVSASATLICEYFRDFGLGFLGRPGNLFSSPLSGIILLALAIPPLGFWFRRQGKPVTFFFAALGLTLFGFVRILQGFNPPLHSFYLHAILPFPALLIAPIFSSAILRIENRLADRSIKGAAGIGLIFSLPFALAILAVGFFNLKDGFLYPTRYVSSDQSSMAHAQEVAAIIDANRKNLASSDVRVFVRGENRLRANAIYFFMRGAFESRMMSANRFIELPRFLRPARGTEGAEARTAYLLVCGEPTKAQIEKFVSKLKQPWELQAEVSLDRCSSCNGCRLSRLRPKSEG